MKIISIDPRTDPLWQKLLNQYKSDVFHSPEWLRVLAETYGFEICAQVLVDDSGEPKAGLPFGRIRDIKGERIITLPFSDYCDPLVGDQDQWYHLANPLLAEECAFTIRCLHNELPLADTRLSLVNKAKWHGLDLRPDLEVLWNNLDGSARRAIRKAEKEGVTLRIAEHKEELRSFFEMHLGVRKSKYRLLAQPYQFFEKIWDHLLDQQKGILLTALYQDQIIGGVLFLTWKDTFYYKFNASSPAQLSFRPNDLVIWEGIKYAKAKGYTTLDFGLSDWDQEGLVRYKRKFGPEEKTISFLRHTPNGGPTARDKQLQDLFTQLTDLLTQESLPDHVTEKGGEILYRFFI